MYLPTCEICQKLNASILICLEHDGQTEKHHICMGCVGEIAESELTDLLETSNLDFAKIKSILKQIQKWQKPQEPDSEEIATLQKLQAMMGDEGESNLEELAEKVLFEDVSKNSEDNSRCSQCGTSWKSMHEEGLLGCPHCYIAFASPLRNVMEHLHFGAKHTGKIPRFREKQERLKDLQEKREKHRMEMLQRRLDAAIVSENYEEAAQIRDKMAQVSK